jgi:predicted MFS family arabinose efflux permease
VLATSTLCGPLIIFCPVLVKDVLHGDASEFSLTIGEFGVGGLLGAVGLLGIDAQRDRRWLSSAFAAGYGAIVALAAINRWSWGLPILLVFAGVSMSVSNTSANSLLQATVAASRRGRTISLFMLAMRGGVSIGSPANRNIREFDWGALRAIDQRGSCPDGAYRDRAAMDRHRIARYRAGL